MVRVAKPLLLNKITPEEYPSFKLLKYCKAAEHMPALEKPMLENPILDKPTQAKPTLENPTQLNKKIYNKNKSSMYEEIPQSNQSKEETKTELTEILQNCELKSFESKTVQMLESAVRVLYYKQSIKLSGDVLPQAEIRNLLRKVNRDTLIDAVEVLRLTFNTRQRVVILCSPDKSSTAFSLCLSVA